ncbi:MAG: hypothetical protein JXB10_20160, partial [Pirellulales bacterium]|nr:hypothetical protein [Pirellulales bacterium]
EWFHSDGYDDRRAEGPVVHSALGIAQGDHSNTTLATAQGANRSTWRTNRWPDGPQSPSSGLRPPWAMPRAG